MAYTLREIKNQMESHYPTASLEEEFGGRLTYHLPTANLRWSRVFSHVEKHRSHWRVVDYSLTQPSLEDVFLDIAKKKAEEKNRRKKKNRQPQEDNGCATRESNATIYDEENGRVTRGTNT